LLASGVHTISSKAQRPSRQRQKLRTQRIIDDFGQNCAAGLRTKLYKEAFDGTKQRHGIVEAAADEL